MRKFLWLLLIAGFLGCAPMKTSDENKPTALNQSDEVVFMSFQIRKDVIQKKNTIVLLNKVKTTAKIKKQIDADVHSANFLTAEMYSGDRFLQMIMIPHPMYVHSEYADESGKLNAKDVVLDQAEFFIRFQQNGANNIWIFETLNDKNKQELLQLKF